MDEASLKKGHTEEDVHDLGEKLYVSHYTPLYRYLFFRLRNKRDAEDLVQTVFVKAFASLKDGIKTVKAPPATPPRDVVHTRLEQCMVDEHDRVRPMLDAMEIEAEKTRLEKLK